VKSFTSRLLKKGFSQPADPSVISPKGENYWKAARFAQGVENQMCAHVQNAAFLNTLLGKLCTGEVVRIAAR